MNIRQAMFKAADSIEQNTNIYHFMSSGVPPCGSPGCLIGLIGLQFGVSIGVINERACRSIFGFENTKIFYDKMTDLHVDNWTLDPLAAVEVLRLYADKYHPAEVIKGIPESVLEIFRPAVAA